MALWNTAPPSQLRMATNSTLSSTITPEVLTNDNYANWSVWMENYLLAQDLWDIVEATTEPPTPERNVVEFKAWRKNNAAALHAILISCGMDILPEIKEIRSAKIVWDKLATMYGPGNSSNILADSSSNNVPEVSLAGEGTINNDLLQYGGLITAIIHGDWDYAKDFLSEHEDAKRARRSDNGYTILHIAVFGCHTKIVEKLVALMSEEELEITDNYGWTALGPAVFVEKTGIVDCMLTKNPNLFNIPDNLNRIPLVMALETRKVEMARHLYYVSLPYQTLSDINSSTVLTHFIVSDNFVVALHLLHRYPRAAIGSDKYDSSPLLKLATKSSAFPSGNRLVFWKNWIYACIPIRTAHSTDEIHIEIHNLNKHKSDQVKISGSVLGILHWLASNLDKLLGIKQIYEMKLLHHRARQFLHLMCSQVEQMNPNYVNEAIFKAIKGGIVEFIEEILEVDSNLQYAEDEMGRTILFYAVLHRQAKLFTHIHRLFKDRAYTINEVDNSNNSILHMVAILETSTTRDRIAGEALKMQSELQWFKEVEKIRLPWLKVGPNDANMTAKELFTHNHMDMMKKGEKWMKATATSCTVVGALIITIMFTAAFTVPGGNNQSTGFPMFSNKNLFTVFIISDSLSLISSSTSVLIFLGILTSRYAEEDFLLSLPTKMIIGLFTLFFSITTMMITFCAGLYIMLPEKPWMVIPVICLACFTVIQFGLMHIPLLVDMLKSTINVWTGTLW